MASITTRKVDVVWNYLGTIVSMSSGFILLPLLMLYLTSEELGLWYVYLALSNFALLFEFGFSPTFARNIVYVVSGARRLTVRGCDVDSVEAGIDWHLLNIVIKASKVIYAIIAVVVTFLLATAGSVYVAHVTRGGRLCCCVGVMAAVLHFSLLEPLFSLVRHSLKGVRGRCW